MGGIFRALLIAFLAVVLITPSLDSFFIIAGVDKNNEAFANGIDAITPSNPALRNTAGEEITSLEVGHQASIAVSLHNNNQEAESFIAIIEVRDGIGFRVLGIAKRQGRRKRRLLDRDFLDANRPVHSSWL